MKYLIVLLFLMGCSIPARKTNNRIDTDIKIINCTNQFLDRNLSGKTSFDICREIYERRD